MHFSKEQLPSIAGGLLTYLREHKNKNAATVLALSGELGAGKTALVQQLARLLGVEQTPPSPTFVIMRSYATTDTSFTKLVHIDAYRIEEKTELGPLKLTDTFAEKDSLVCIEWPQKLQGAVPEKAIEIKLISVSGEVRDILTEESLESTLQNSLNMVQ